MKNHIAWGIAKCNIILLSIIKIILHKTPCNNNFIICLVCYLINQIFYWNQVNIWNYKNCIPFLLKTTSLIQLLINYNYYIFSITCNIYETWIFTYYYFLYCDISGEEYWDRWPSAYWVDSDKQMALTSSQDRWNKSLLIYKSKPDTWLTVLDQINLLE